MFETSVVRVQAKAAERRFGLLSVSLAAHAAAIIGVLAASVASVRLPDRAPNQMEMLRIGFVPPLQGGSPNGGPKPKPAAAQPVTPKRETAPQQTVAPRVVPDTVVPQPGPTSPSNDDVVGPADGPGNGQRIGVPDGPPDGLPIGAPQPPAPPQPDVVYRVSANVKAPVVLKRVNPIYPAIAVHGGISGFAVVDCIIDKSGHIRDARIVGSSFGAFEQPALDAVQQWVFAPGTRDGQPVNVEFELRVTFQIHR